MPCFHLPSLLASIVVASLVPQGFAHSCSDGSSLTCMTVHSSPDAHAIGEGFSAGGYPFCTPEGEKVFCLVDHQYHRCGTGEQSCCQDGSDPSHGSSNSRRRNGYSHGGRRMDGRRSHDVFTCTPANEPSKATEVTTARPKAVTFTLYKENFWCTSWGSTVFTTKILWGEKSGKGGERMGDGNQSISECAAYVAADTDCSQTFYAQSGVCECVRQGDICNAIPSTEGNAIYRVGEVNTYVSLGDGFCRGKSATDNPCQQSRPDMAQWCTQHYPYNGVESDCQALCTATSSCLAYEFGLNQCELWTQLPQATSLYPIPPHNSRSEDKAFVCKMKQESPAITDAKPTTQTSTTMVASGVAMANTNSMVTRTTEAATTKVATTAAAATAAKGTSSVEANAMATSTTSATSITVTTHDKTATTITTTTSTPEPDIQPESQKGVSLLASDLGASAEPMARGAHAHKTGVLTLGARGDEGSDGALHDQIEEHKWIIQAVIEDRLGSPQVDVLGIVVARGRRLQESSNHVFEVHFQSLGSTISMSEANTGLKTALQESFVAADVGVIVEFASLRWTSSGVSPEGQREENNMFSIPVIVGLALAALLTVAACGIFAKILMRKPTEHLTLASMQVVENQLDEEKMAGIEVGASAEKFTTNNPATHIGLAQTYGEEKALGIDVEKAFEINSGPNQWENNCEEDWGGECGEPWDESWEKKQEEKWEMRSSSTSEGGTRSQTSGGDTISESHTNDGWTTAYGTALTGGIEGDV